MKKHPYLISFIIFIIIFFIINKISKNFLETTKWEKDNRKSYVEKVYGKEQVKDYLKVIEEQTRYVRMPLVAPEVVINQLELHNSERKR